MVLPLPVGPMTAVSAPGSAVMTRPLSTGASAPGWLSSTPRHSTRQGREGRAAAPTGGPISGSVPRTWVMRSALTSPRGSTMNRPATVSTEVRISVRYVMSAVSAPIRMLPSSIQGGRSATPPRRRTD